MQKWPWDTIEGLILEVIEIKGYGTMRGLKN